MVTLKQLKEMAGARFQGGSPGLPHFLFIWAGSADKNILEILLAGSDITLKKFTETMKSFLNNVENEDRMLVIEAIKNSMDNATNGSDLLNALCLSPANHIFKALEECGMISTQVLENIRLNTRPNTSFSSVGVKPATASTILERFGRDLTALAKTGAFDELSYRHTEIKRIVNVLLRKRKSNPVVTGPAGIGKTALIELLAREITTRRFPALENVKIFEVSLSKMVAGCIYRGMFEERFEAVMKEVSYVPGTILFLDEIHNLIGVGKAEGIVMDGANMIKPYLARDKFKLIGATTAAEFNRFIRSDEALERRFQEVKLSEPTAETLKLMVEKQALALKKFHHVDIPAAVIERAIEITNRYLPNKHQPDKTIDLLDTTAVSLKQNGINHIDSDDLLDTLADMTGMPISRLTGSDRKSLKALAGSIKNKIIGQDEAVEKVVQSLIYRRMDIEREARPVGVFLFAGDTGVGKTELARNIALHFMGSINKLVHINLGEYKGYAAKNKLIGVEPGYMGSENEGELIKGLQNNPSAVLLFDEIEKADHQIQDIILRLTDNGFITDSKGLEWDARQCVIVMTTNAITSKELKQKQLGFSSRPQKFEHENIKKTLEKHFKKEFLGRFDDIIFFNSLSSADYEKILKLRIQEALDKLKRKGINVKVDKSRLASHLIKYFNPEKGARGIQRLLEEKFLQPLSMKMLFAEEDSKQKIDICDYYYTSGIIKI